jgi:predicted Zn-dependent protease
MDPLEVEAAATRIAKIVGGTITLTQPAPVPKAGDDPARGQHLAGPFLAELRGQLVRFPVAKRVTAHASEAAAGAAAGGADVALFVTDVDLYKPQTDGVFGDIDAVSHTAILSVRRLREVFYKRKPDPAKARARLVKLALYALARARSVPDCNDRACVMAGAGSVADLDMKPEKYCASCWRRISTGAFRI